MRIKKRAQATAEYAIIIGLVIGAAIAMQIYVRRGLSGGLKFVTDKLKSSNTGTAQYEPYYLMSEATVTQEDVYSSEETFEGGKVVREMGTKDGTDGEKTTRKSKHQLRGIDAKD